jgi:signal transduction histidine kinase
MAQSSAIGDARLRAELGEVAQLALDSTAATACVIAYGDRHREGLIQAPASPPSWVDLESLTFKLKSARAVISGNGKLATLSVNAAEAASNQPSAAAIASRFRMVAAAASDESVWTIVGLLLDLRRKEVELQAQLAMLSRLAMATATRRVQAASRDFWRERASATAAAAASAKGAASRIEDDRRRVEQALLKAMRLASRRRLSSLGEIAAALGPFDAWIVALVDGDALKVESCFGLESAPRLDRKSAVAESFKRQKVFARSVDRERAKIFCEDRLFADRGLSTYLCVPFEAGAIALGARRPIDSSSRGRIEAFVAGIAPAIKAWTLEAELVRQRGLVRNLALRLISAGELERARISRDLHDDHAQLLSAARIALSARRGAAKKILKELEGRMRSRLLDLRPALLGRHSLREAIALELRRLEAARVETRFLAQKGIASLARPIQQVCYQIAREAVSNIIRHAGAKRVEVGLSRANHYTRLTISDDGCGVIRKNGRGSGLRGLAERVELLGGRCRLESRRGKTTLVAEIPEIGR